MHSLDTQHSAPAGVRLHPTSTQGRKFAGGHPTWHHLPSTKPDNRLLNPKPVLVSGDPCSGKKNEPFAWTERWWCAGKEIISLFRQLAQDPNLERKKILALSLTPSQIENADEKGVFGSQGLGGGPHGPAGKRF